MTKKRTRTPPPDPDPVEPRRIRPDPPPPPPPEPGGAGDNHLINGCFVGVHGAAPPSPWVPSAGWDVSVKPSNPCGGYAARINDPSQSGFSGPNRDERIYQVVAGHGPHLIAEMMGIHHHAIYADMNIYGGPSADGPWVLVWHPFSVADCKESTAADRDWGTNLPHEETDIAQAFPFYKVEFAAMYAAVGPAGDQGGIKFTKAYFKSS